VQRQMRLAVRGPALRQDHGHPQAGGDAMSMELPRGLAPGAEVARPETEHDDGDDDQHVIWRMTIWHGAPSPLPTVNINFGSSDSRLTGPLKAPTESRPETVSKSDSCNTR